MDIGCVKNFGFFTAVKFKGIGIPHTPYQNPIFQILFKSLFSVPVASAG